MSNSKNNISEFVRNNIDGWKPDPDAITRMNRMLNVDRTITDINVKDSTYYDYTALHYQARWGSKDSVAWLLRQDPPPDINVRSSRTPLMMAVLSDEDAEGKVKLLLEYGADRYSKDLNDDTAQTIAIKLNKPRVTDILKNYKPDVSADAIGRRKEAARQEADKQVAAATTTTPDTNMNMDIDTPNPNPNPNVTNVTNAVNTANMMAQVLRNNIAEFVRNNLDDGPDPDAITRMNRMLNVDRTITDINVKDSTYYDYTALHYQALYGTKESVAWLLRQDPPPNIDMRDSSDESTPLINAVFSDEDPEGKVKLLLVHGANRDLKNKNGYTALDIARNNSMPASVIDMLENYRPDVSADHDEEVVDDNTNPPSGATTNPPSTYDSNNANLVAEFVRNNLEGAPDPDAISRMNRMLNVDKTITDINVKDSNYYDYTALQYQSRYGTTESVAWLLRQDPPPNIDVRDRKFQYTPLMYTVLTGKDPEGKLRLLIEYGADRDIKNKDDYTALEMAKFYKKPASVIDILENYKPDVSADAVEARREAARKEEANSSPPNPNPPTAAKDTENNITKFVLNNLPNKDDSDAISRMYRMIYTDKTISNVKVKVQGSNDTALHHQANLGTKDAVGWLLTQDPPPDINVKNTNEFTPLMFAVGSKIDSKDKVQLLLEYGADRDIKNNKSQTALEWAKSKNKPASVIDMLENYKPDVSADAIRDRRKNDIKTYAFDAATPSATTAATPSATTAATPSATTSSPSTASAASAPALDQWESSVEKEKKEWLLDLNDLLNEENITGIKSTPITFYKWLDYNNNLKKYYTSRAWVEVSDLSTVMDFSRFKEEYRKMKNRYIKNEFGRSNVIQPETEKFDDKNQASNDEWMTEQNNLIEEYKKNPYFFEKYESDQYEAKQKAEEERKKKREKDLNDKINSLGVRIATPDIIEDDNDILLEQTPDNITWINNKNFIKNVIYNVNDNGSKINNYGNNLLLYYNNKIGEVQKLMEGKSNDLTKNFMGDITIQDEQIKNISKTIENSEIAKSIDESIKNKITKGYYKQIGNKSTEVMGKDYDDRNKTIQYLLLIKEYELLKSKIKDSITDDENVEDTDSSEFTVSQDMLDKLDNKDGDDLFNFKGVDINDNVSITKGGGKFDNIDFDFNSFVSKFDNLNKNSFVDSDFTSLYLEFLIKLQIMLGDPMNYDSYAFQSVIYKLKEIIRKTTPEVMMDSSYSSMKGGSGLLSSATIDTKTVNDQLSYLREGTNYIQNNSDEEQNKINASDINVLYTFILEQFKSYAMKQWMSYHYTIEILNDNLDRMFSIVETKIENLIRTHKVELGNLISNQKKTNLPQNYIDFYKEVKNVCVYTGTIDQKIVDKITNDREFARFIDNKKKLIKTAVNIFTKQANEAYDKKTLSDFDIETEDAEKEYQHTLKDKEETTWDNTKKFAYKLLALLNKSDYLNKKLQDEAAKEKVYEDKKLAAQKLVKEKSDEISQAAKDSSEKFKDVIDTASKKIKQFEKELDQLNDIKTNDIISIEKEEMEMVVNEMMDIRTFKIINNADNVIDKKRDEACDELSNAEYTLPPGSKIDPKEEFIREIIKPHFLKNNLYEFIKVCKKLDSAPAWRAKISKLIAGYLTSFMSDPNDKTKHTVVMPSYEYFNLVFTGTPGVGKSYTSKLIAEALKWCGFLTKGKIQEVKKPDIVGSYTGQTAPKVYKELTQGLGNVIFIDEAYSIAGPQNNEGKFNDFGQEAIDAITDYTSEHIGLMGFICAGYEYEMRNQFLNVNIGMPRRFPSVYVLRRYDMKAFWKILEVPISKFCPKYQVSHHHHACFEILNLMFNYQCCLNPTLKLSTEWTKWWEGYKLQNLMLNLKVSNIDITIPIAKLDDFQGKLNNMNDNDENKIISSKTIKVIPTASIFDGNTIDEESKLTTNTFLKSYIIYKFCQSIANGDLFRNQADNLTKFAQTILSNKILNPDNEFKADQDILGPGNRDWVEYLYFSLYFSQNPNKTEVPITNIEFKFVDAPVSAATGANATGANATGATETPDATETASTGGYRVKTQKQRQIFKPKNTKRKHTKTGNKTSRKNKKQNRIRNKRRKTYKQRGGDLSDIVQKLKGILGNLFVDLDETADDNTYLTEAFLAFNIEGDTDIDKGDKLLAKLEKMKPKIDYIAEKFSLTNPTIEDIISKAYDNLPDITENFPAEATKNWGYFQVEIIYKYLTDNEKTNAALNTGNAIAANFIDTAAAAATAVTTAAGDADENAPAEKAAADAADENAADAVDEKAAAEKAAAEKAMFDKLKAEKNEIMKQSKDLIFDINIDFSSQFNSVGEIIETIKDTDVYKNKSADDKKDEDCYFKRFQDLHNLLINNIYGDDKSANLDLTTLLPQFVNTYLLLECYNIAVVREKQPAGRFNVDDWWFFTNGDFSSIKNTLNYATVLKKFNNVLDPNIVPCNPVVETSATPNAAATLNDTNADITDTAVTPNATTTNPNAANTDVDTSTTTNPNADITDITDTAATPNAATPNAANANTDVDTSTTTNPNAADTQLTDNNTTDSNTADKKEQTELKETDTQITDADVKSQLLQRLDLEPRSSPDPKIIKSFQKKGHSLPDNIKDDKDDKDNKKKFRYMLKTLIDADKVAK
jgi:ankyrin repeat protein